jgi:acetyl-CoA carboxylase biotin carboxyl carrier protein
MMKKSNDSQAFAEEKKMTSKIDYEEINRLIALLEQKNLSHFELEVEGFKIKISRNTPALASTNHAALSPVSPQPERKEISLPLDPLPQVQASQNNIHYVTSPMVGTFYRAPDPTAPPFVEIGDSIKKSQTLCIIEAMKLMNEIESDVEGVIKDIFVENGKPVEYGQKLFAIQVLS